MRMRLAGHVMRMDHEGVDNKSSGEMDTMKWKKESRSTKNRLDSNSKGGHKEMRWSQLHGASSGVGSRQEDLERADRPVCHSHWKI